MASKDSSCQKGANALSINSQVLRWSVDMAIMLQWHWFYYLVSHLKQKGALSNIAATDDKYEIRCIFQLNWDHSRVDSRGKEIVQRYVSKSPQSLLLQDIHACMHACHNRHIWSNLYGPLLAWGESRWGNNSRRYLCPNWMLWISR